MAKQDYYATLGVAREAGAEDLKKAYRKLAMQYPPRPQSRGQAGRGEVQGGQRGLRHPEGRAEARRLRSLRPRGIRAGRRPGGFNAGFDFSAGGGLGDIFDQMFGEFMGGRRGGAGRTRAGNDIRQAVEIDLAEAFTGTKVEPAGTDARGRAMPAAAPARRTRRGRPTPAPTCRGAGKVRAQQGFFLIERTCPTCGGQGRVIRNPCKVCHGAGTVQRERTLQVAIPPGVEDGTRIRLAGEGEAGGQGAPPGDLYVHVAIRPHPIFQRDGANIFMRVPLRMTQAALGGDIEVPAIDGTQGQGEDPARHADRRSVPPARQGLLGAAQRGARRHVHPGRRWRRRRT